tara:strand:+ start:5881 stop:6429 length:549 start_codon:yes stop_codon:yes gene_type:complete
MALKLTDLTALGATPDAGDFLHVVDISDTSGSADGTSKKVAYSNIGGGGTNNVQHAWGFYDPSIRNVYIPITSESEYTSVQRFNQFISPFTGTLKKSTFMSSTLQTGGTGTLTLAIGSVTGSGSFLPLETATITLPLSSYTTATFVFTTNSMVEGSRYAFFLSGQGSIALNNCNGTFLFEIT